jgi:hypothetical protein
MTIEHDTEWLRAELTKESFHKEYTQQWVAVRDGKVVHSTREHAAMQKWLELEDSDRQCVLAFGDDRALV